MTPEEIQAVVLEILRKIAPEMAGAKLLPDKPLREQLELDSMDFLNFVIGLNKRLGVSVPESDYRILDTLDHCVAYLARREQGTAKK